FKLGRDCNAGFAAYWARSGAIVRPRVRMLERPSTRDADIWSVALFDPECDSLALYDLHDLHEFVSYDTAHIPTIFTGVNLPSLISSTAMTFRLVSPFWSKDHLPRTPSK